MTLVPFGQVRIYRFGSKSGRTPTFAHRRFTGLRRSSPTIETAAPTITCGGTVDIWNYPYILNRPLDGGRGMHKPSVFGMKDLVSLRCRVSMRSNLRCRAAASILTRP